MIAPRQFMLCPTEPAARALDSQILAVLRVRDGSKAGQYAGVSVRDDGQFGVLLDERLVPVDIAAAQVLDTEVLTADGTSNWSDYVPPVEDEP